MATSPFNTLSRGMADAVEQTPAHQAMVARRQFIPTTIGDLASRLVETGEVKPSTEAVCDFLMIDREDLNDPELHFTSDYEGFEFTNRLQERWTSQYIAEEGPKGKAFNDYLANAVAEWVDPELREQGKVLWQEVNKAPYPETDEEHREIALKEMKASAYHSGVAISPDQLIEKALAYNGPQAFTVAEIVSAAMAMLEEYNHYRGLDSETKVSDLVLGADQIGEFRSGLAMTFRRNAAEYAEAKFDRIKHLFMAPQLHDHVLFVGGEK